MKEGFSLDQQIPENNQKRFEVVSEFVKRKTNEEIIACLERNFSNAEKIGEGKNAEVFGLAEGAFEKMCVKRLRKGVPKTNGPKEEFQFQEKVDRAGVRTPLAIMWLRDTLTREEYIIMEKIKGSSLAEIFSGAAYTPENFDLDTFIKELDNQVHKMNNAGIFHRDLHEGNIMIDENGDPVIIDFGQAFEWSGDKENVEVIYFEENPVLYDTRTKKAMISRVPGWYPKDREDSHDGRLIGGELLRITQKLRSQLRIEDALKKGTLDNIKDML